MSATSIRSICGDAPAVYDGSCTARLLGVGLTANLTAICIVGSTERPVVAIERDKQRAVAGQFRSR